jgi:hypothetical protein
MINECIDNERKKEGNQASNDMTALMHTTTVRAPLVDLLFFCSFPFVFFFAFGLIYRYADSYITFISFTWLCFSFSQPLEQSTCPSLSPVPWSLSHNSFSYYNRCGHTRYPDPAALFIQNVSPTRSTLSCSLLQ